MRKKYAEEYKTSAVNMVLLEGKSPTEVARNLERVLKVAKMAKL
jgi:transposase-like protein